MLTFANRSLLLQAAVLPAVSLLLLALYWPGLQGGFIFDDFSSIVENPALRSTDGSIASLTTAASSGISGPLGRPLSMLSFAANLHLFGAAPYSFKVTNLAIHIANAALFFVIALQLGRWVNRTSRVRAWLLAAAVAAAWAMHPLNAMPVLYVVQRMTSLSALFSLCALSLWLFGRQAQGARGVLAMAASILVLWPAAVFSKETGLLLPAHIFLCEWLVLGTFRTVPTRLKWWAAAIAGVLLSTLCWAKWGFITAGYSVRDFGMVERLMTEARVLWFYVGQLLLPAPHFFGLFHDDIPISRGLFAPPETLLAIAGWVAVAMLAFWQRARRPLFAFAVFWFLASHALESTLFPLEIAHEHRNYIASFGIVLWLFSFMLPVQANARWPVPRLVLAISFVSFCGLVTTLRSMQWANEFLRSQADVANHPNSARSNFQAASAIMQRTFEAGGGNALAYQSVQFFYRRAAELDKNGKAALVGLVYLDCITGVQKDAALRARLLERFVYGRYSLGDRGIVQSLSGLLVEGRLCMDDNEAKALIEAALSNPYADATTRAMIYAVAMDYAVARLNSVPLAIGYAQAAVASDPGSAALRSNLIRLLLRANRVEEARREYTWLIENFHAVRDRPVLNELKTLVESMGTSANTN
ncbi:tetratricopeptide repeat protein [Ramlibacter sp. WS9]|uniref:tetratricopeptide repeat protein n=1 Tax=Ramlibacter sp. WS9 TaxID=1882741 RepID=UPI001143C8A7|nr:tetratricopeptide repeat protein [Ramlibacter sp. WS9]ROZ79140.1 tetratricopeptide repeat protein [Ramlibacter sp. WS9]